MPSPANGIEGYFDPLPADARTIAHDLNDLGYETAYFGKWHLGRRDPKAPLVGDVHARTRIPEAERGGFRFWEGFESGYLLNDPWLHGTRLPNPTRFTGYQSNILCERAAEHMASQASPSFTVVSLEAPHPPYDALSAGVFPQAPSAISLRDNVPADKTVRERARKELSGYYAHIEATDRAIGWLLAEVPSSTVIVFTSVHGDMHGSHGLFRKGWPYEESVRVPLLLRLPRGMSAGESHSAISLVDLAALTRRIAGGNFAIPQIDSAKISMPSVVRLPLQCDKVWTGIRTPGEKLVLNADRTPWLYFDLKNDPLELTNRASDPASAEGIERLTDLL